MPRDYEKIRCAFCGRALQEVRHMVYQSKQASICDDCVTLCQELIQEADQERVKIEAEQKAQPRLTLVRALNELAGHESDAAGES